MTEVWKEHVPVTGTQHDPANGLLHGYCARCRTPWPCLWSPESHAPPPSTDGRVRFTQISCIADGQQSRAALYALDTDGRLWGLAVRDLGANQANGGGAWWLVPAPTHGTASASEPGVSPATPEPR